MTELEEGLQRVGLLNVIRDVLKRLVYATGCGVPTTVYDALFRWVSTEHMKVALVGVVPGVLPVSIYDYEALQNDLRFPETNATGCRVLGDLVNKYLNTCPIKSYTAEFLRPIASVCQLTDYTQGAVDWWVTQLLANVPDGDDLLYYSTTLQERCKEYVEGLTLPRTETNKNYPARVLQHLIYYNEMLHSEQNNKPSIVSRMSLG